MAGSNRDRWERQAYYKSATEQHWQTGSIPSFYLTGDPDLDAMKTEFFETMERIFNMRVHQRGTSRGVGRPPITFEDYFADPKLLECYYYIEKWKYKQWQEANKKVIVH